MSMTRGEGRSISEKSSLIITPWAFRQAEKERMKQEEAEWASKCGPVTVRRISDDNNSD